MPAGSSWPAWDQAPCSRPSSTLSSGPCTHFCSLWLRGDRSGGFTWLTPLPTGFRIRSPGCSLDIPKVLAIVEIPGRGMAHHFPPVGRLLQHRLVPELERHRQQPQGGEEIICFLKHLFGCPSLQTEGALTTLGTVGTDCVPQRGGDWKKAQLGGTPGSEGPLPPQQVPPFPCVLGPPWRSRSTRKEQVRTCFIMASVASILGAEGKGTTKS